MTQAEFALASDVVGWHGKLPVAGDFVTRRLHSVFVDAWDEWLSNGLAGLRERDADHWLGRYLASPPWRFVITQEFMPSPLNAATWAGVLVPSVDRVGRYYPLTLVTRLNGIPAGHLEQAGLWSWLHKLEDLAVDAMLDEWSIDQLDAESLRLGQPVAADSVQGQLDDSGPWASFFSACLEPLPAVGGGRCVWFSGAVLQSTKLWIANGRDDSVQGLWT
jgi:type VI secretion system ImpM family protein